MFFLEHFSAVYPGFQGWRGGFREQWGGVLFRRGEIKKLEFFQTHWLRDSPSKKPISECVGGHELCPTAAIEIY